jgi:hypothetical protein
LGNHILRAEGKTENTAAIHYLYDGESRLILPLPAGLTGNIGQIEHEMQRKNKFPVWIGSCQFEY